LLTVVSLDVVTVAEGMGRWKVWRGDGRATATVYSLNSLTTGSRTIDYRPALVVSCQAGRYPVWRQELSVRRIISGDDIADVSIRFDNGGSFAEQWTLSDMNRSLRNDGDHAVARLARARRFYVEWSFGVFSGRGEAVFDVDGISGALTDMANACGTAVP